MLSATNHFMPIRNLRHSTTGVIHIYNRGVEKRLTYLDYPDYSRFKKRAIDYAAELKIGIYEGCLMPNHFHLMVMVPDLPTTQTYMHRLQLGYAMYFNKRHDRVGSLFQGRFKAIAIETDEQFMATRQYIRRNPEKLGVDPATYPWRWSNEGLARPGLEQARVPVLDRVAG